MATAHARPLILLVEDHADTREMYAEYLGAFFDVIEAADGQEALGLLEGRAPAVVITDFSLPGIDGFELIRRIRDNEATAHIPVICLSGHAGRTHEERAREVGCDRVLEKPCLPDRLAEAALEVVRLGRSA
jgi:chemosensory pili system protein ChpA (sensor histidine kinase/response regulator)